MKKTYTKKDHTKLEPWRLENHGWWTSDVPPIKADPDGDHFQQARYVESLISKHTLPSEVVLAIRNLITEISYTAPAKEMPFHKRSN